MSTQYTREYKGTRTKSTDVDWQDLPATILNPFPTSPIRNPVRSQTVVIEIIDVQKSHNEQPTPHILQNDPIG